MTNQPHAGGNVVATVWMGLHGVVAMIQSIASGREAFISSLECLGRAGKLVE